MLVSKDLWLLVQYGKDKPHKVDALTLEVMNLKVVVYIWCFIDMSLYYNFKDET